MRRPACAAAMLMLLCGPGPAGAAGTVETSGDVLRWAVPAAAGVVAWRRGDRDGLRQFAVAFTATAASTLALKALVDKDRPDGDGSDAFPSGHAATAFAGATFLHRRYGWRDALPAYGLSAYVGWTRVDADKHEVEDVVAGAALAALWSWYLVDPAPPLTPVVLRDGALLTFSLRW